MADFSNAYGAVQLADGGIPRTITYKARCDISGGYWVNGSSAQGIVSSGANTYVSSDIEGFPVTTQIGSQVIGFNLQDTASGTYGTAAMRGLYIVPLLSGTGIGSAYAGQKFAAGSAGTIVPIMSGLAHALADASAGWHYFDIGTLMSEGTCAAGQQYVMVSLNI